jgi:hypothetical protein
MVKVWGRRGKSGENPGKEWAGCESEDQMTRIGLPGEVLPQHVWRGIRGLSRWPTRRAALILLGAFGLLAWLFGGQGLAA